jgi:3-oxoadipate enol-lactonase
MAPSLAVEETGTGRALVLLHGIVADHRVWAPVAPALARERRVVAIDLPGFGRSEPAGSGFDLEAVAAAILTGLRAHGVEEPFDLVGHSLGGGVAIQLAAQHPGVVARLILVAPAGLTPLPPRLATLVRGVGSLGHLVPAVLARSVENASPTARSNGQAVVTISTVDLRPRLREITAPIGVIWGEADRTVPIRGLDELIARRPEAQVVRLPEIGHVPMVEAPERFVAALWGLIGDLAPTSTSARPS